MKNLWLHTEERQRHEVLKQLMQRYADDRTVKFKCSDEVLIRSVVIDKRFQFAYQLEGYDCEGIEDCFFTTVSGFSSFVDYIILDGEKGPNPDQEPLYLIEETKTDDSESRNTGVYQRSSKFVYASFFYPEIQQVMLYNLRVTQKEEP